MRNDFLYSRDNHAVIETIDGEGLLLSDAVNMTDEELDQRVRRFGKRIIYLCVRGIFQPFSIFF